MRKNLAAIAAVCSLVACSVATIAPDAPVVAAIKSACAADALLRPSASILIAIPGLATPGEAAAVLAARAVVDPICANPDGSIGSNAAAAVEGATGQILAVVAQIGARRK